MATIYPNKRAAKAVSYKFKALLGRDRNKKQIVRCTAWTPLDGLAPSKEAKTAERAADAWEVWAVTGTSGKNLNHRPRTVAIKNVHI